jgi:ABC-2 type transport system permease protein
MSATPDVPPVRRVNATDPMYWSIRRELWENRSLTIAPIAVAGFLLLIILVSSFGFPRRMRNLPLEPAARHAAVVHGFWTAPSPIVVTTIIVAIFFCLDALYGERRERSILFWKSLPVSDRTTVLSKAIFPLALLPLFGFALGVAVQLFALLWSTLLLIANGIDPTVLWGELRLLEMPVVLLYGIAAFTLWHAPLYGLLLLISGSARRMPILWALLPPIVITIIERMIFHTSYVGRFLQHRIMGAMTAAFDFAAPPVRGKFPILDRVTQLDPGKFLSTPGLWLGLLFAAACIVASIRLRRYREPI